MIQHGCIFSNLYCVSPHTKIPYDKDQATCFPASLRLFMCAWHFEGHESSAPKHEKSKDMTVGGGNRWLDSVTVRLPGNRRVRQGNVWKTDRIPQENLRCHCTWLQKEVLTPPTYVPCGRTLEVWITTARETSPLLIQNFTPPQTLNLLSEFGKLLNSFRACETLSYRFLIISESSTSVAEIPGLFCDSLGSISRLVSQFRANVGGNWFCWLEMNQFVQSVTNEPV